MTNRTWVLGAADPEMAAIEQLLVEWKQTVIYAVDADGKRVHPGNAYRAVLPMPEPDREYVLVECGAEAAHPLQPGVHPVYTCQGGYAYTHCPEGGQFAGNYAVTRVDHHNPGDPGYGRPPADFLPASSIGQVFRFVHGYGGEWGISDNWQLSVDCGDGVYRLVTPPPAVVLTAAADHCLGAAYAGKCPGVFPDELMKWRVEQRATFQKKSVEEVLRSVNYAREVLRVALAPELPWELSADDGLWMHHPVRKTVFHGAADLRDIVVDELPEAAARDGVAYVTTVTDRDGRVKDVVGGNTTPEQVSAWMAAMRAEGREVYGDPMRGFAGSPRKPGDTDENGRQDRLQVAGCKSETG